MFQVCSAVFKCFILLRTEKEKLAVACWLVCALRSKKTIKQTILSKTNNLLRKFNFLINLFY